MVQTRPSREDYEDWLRDSNIADLSDAVRTHYESVSRTMREHLLADPIWRKIRDQLADTSGEYMVANGMPLLPQEGLHPTIETKPYESLVEKSFRKNIVENGSFPDPPEGGWVTPDNWLERITDTLRMSVHVRYLDGVQRVCDALSSCCIVQDVDHSVDFEAREVGYYAAHFLFWREFEVRQPYWGTKTTSVAIEIQVATVIHGLVRGLLHKYYEQHRTRRIDPEIKWQWDYESNEFATNYISHMSHYLDGMIIGARKRQQEDAR